MPVIDYMDARHNLPTVEEIRKTWCFGLPLYAKSATQWTAAGQVMSDEDIELFIRGAISDVEKQLGVLLKPTIVRNQYTAYLQSLQEGIDYDILEPAYDYAYDRFNNWGFMQTRQWPFLSIDGFKMTLPNGQQVLDFGSDQLGGMPPKPTSWIKPYPKQGQIMLVPYTGVSSVFYVGGGTSSAGALSILGNMWTRDMPQCLWLDYTAGFALGKVPSGVRNIVAKMAANDVLGIAGDALLAGIASMSTSIDGLSQSISTTASATNNTYAAHQLQYQKEINAFFDPKHGGARSYYKGITLTVL
jgi:hypothetical protein